MSEPPRFRKKPLEIEAMRWDGSAEGATPIIDWVLAGDGSASYHDPSEDPAHGWASLSIQTLEGRMTASPGDFVIRGIKGEFYPCKPDIFQATYDDVAEGIEGSAEALDEAIVALRRAEGWAGVAVGWLVLVATVDYDTENEQSGIETIYPKGGLQWPLAIGILEAARTRMHHQFAEP